MHKQSKILFLARWYPYPGDPMLGLFVENHARALTSLYSIAVIYVHVLEPGQEKGPTGVSQENGVAVFRTYFSASRIPLLGKLVNLCNYAFCQYRGYKALKAAWGQPDLMHVHILTRTALLALFLDVVGGIPFVVTEHWSRYFPHSRQPLTGGLKIFMCRLITAKAKAITAVTRSLLHAMAQLGIKNKKSCVVPNVVDVTRFCISHASEKKGFTFLHVSCYDEPAKNTFGTLRALKQVLALRNNVRLIMAGTGADLEATRAYCKVLGLNDHVIFTGLVVGEELVATYQKSDCLLLFSHYETQGVVLLEAFACGVPVIASNTGGIPEVVDSSRGILVAPGDEAALVNAMLEVVDGYEFGSKEVMRQYVIENFSNDAVANMISGIYESVLTH